MMIKNIIIIVLKQVPHPPGRDPLPGRGRVATGSQERSGKNVYRYDTVIYGVLMIVLFILLFCCVRLI